MIARSAVLLLVVLAGGGAVARAQDPPPAAADQARSRVLYDQGSRAYRDGDYPRAIELFLAAYELSRAPAILFNVAQAYRLDGDCERALTYYRRSLEEEPEAANRAEVEERIAEMQRCVDQQPEAAAAAISPPAAAPAAVVAAPAPAAPPRRRVLPLLTIGVGSAAVVTGGVIYLQARARFAEVEPTCPCEPGSFSGWETATDLSYLLMGAGAAVAGAGVIWWWRESRDRPPRIGLVPTARGVAWAGSF